MEKILRWGVLGATSHIYQGRLKPAMLLGGGRHNIVAEASRANGGEAAYHELLARPDVDAVYIPLPNDSHRPWILRALESGKHVMCEKPLTLAQADTNEVFDAAEASDRVLMEAYMWPHHPRAKRILQMVADGTLGELRTIRSTFAYPAADPTNHRFDERGAGALFDIGIYCIAPPMLMTNRDPQAVAAVAVRNALNVDESMAGFIDWGQSVSSSFEVNFHAASDRSLRIVGSDMVLTLPDFHTPGPEEPCEIHLQGRDEKMQVVPCEGANAFLLMVDQFAATIAGTEPLLFGRAQSVRLAGILDSLHQVSR